MSILVIGKNANQNSIRYRSKSTRMIRFKKLTTSFVGGDREGRKVNRCRESSAESHSNPG